jgi:hypothetical protein
MFRLSAQDNGLYFFRARADVKRCSACSGLVDKWSEDLASVAIPTRPKHDVSYSFDGVLVATERFKEAVEGAGISGCTFWPIQNGLFAARPITAVQYDAVRRGTRFEGRCQSCGQYRSVVGATPVFLVPGASIPTKGFARTDLEFGSGDEKAPVVMCGDDAGDLRRTRLRGVELVREAQGLRAR